MRLSQKQTHEIVYLIVFCIIKRNKNNHTSYKSRLRLVKHWERKCVCVFFNTLYALHPLIQYINRFIPITTGMIFEPRVKINEQINHCVVVVLLWNTHASHSPFYSYKRSHKSFIVHNATTNGTKCCLYTSLFYISHACTMKTV